LESSGIRFDVERDQSLHTIRVFKRQKQPQPLLPGNPRRWYDGMMVIQRK
jgi:hypothetical protein